MFKIADLTDGNEPTTLNFPYDLTACALVRLGYCMRQMEAFQPPHLEPGNLPKEK
jgi:hypothetical protein